ncbi:unnamed protein product [Adineta steineri]|uniref:Peptidase S9 prolyl oligopeptidase catalytic domain-containing protein n=1 Tax=Adineta steineri TaxID=433720 RepID=A0A814NLY6_9BILA|nr:unnamed protein product [Adineta steineri]CAF1094766.1 unnamed protein product [Adineta steineri]
MIHGGPYSASLNKLDFAWYQWSSLAASEGWLVLEPNYRGSTGYGDEFLNEIRYKPVSRPGKDILYGIDQLIQDGIVDQYRLTIGGHSYGGFLTNWLITQTKRFNAALSGAGTIDYTSMWGMTDMPVLLHYLFGGFPWEVPYIYQNETPIYQLDRVRTPTHIVTGENDIRVPTSQSYIFERRLNYLGIPVKLITFPKQGHSLTSNPWHGKIKVREELKWLQKYGNQSLNYIELSDTSRPPLFTYTTKRSLYCSAECHKRITCRTFDFDADSLQCRLWEMDNTTGSIVASPSKPRSSVGSVQISPNNYVNIHNQSCSHCDQSRYEICNVNTSTCQCPPFTYWNNGMCMTQLFQGQLCSHADACRTDLNLSCQPSCDFTYRCSVLPTAGIGLTVAGFCNGSTDAGALGVMGPWGIYVSPFDGILYVTNFDLPRFQSFLPFSRIGSTILSNGLDSPEDIFVDSSHNIYMSEYYIGQGIMYIRRPGMNLTSFPPIGQSGSSCSLTGLYQVIGVVVDQFGNIYAAPARCYMIVKWVPNSTTGILVAGNPGHIGTGSNGLNWPRFMHLDEVRGALYVADTDNNRIQKFMIGGNGTGITVAGGNGPGLNLNQLNGASGVWVTRNGQTLYIADTNNNRVMRWNIGDTQGSVVAGSASGVAGKTNTLLSYPGDVALDPTETYLYISDYNNNRVQRFVLQ